MQNEILVIQRSEVTEFSVLRRKHMLCVSFFLMHDVCELSSAVHNLSPLCLSRVLMYFFTPSISLSLVFSLPSYIPPSLYPLSLSLLASITSCPPPLWPHLLLNSHTENVSPYEEQAEGQRQSQVPLPPFHV